MRRALTTAVTGAAALLVAACGGSGGTAAPASGSSGGADKVTVGVIPIVDVAPIYLGIQQGFFSDRNLDVTMESGQGGAAIVPGVVSGQFQFGFSNVTSLILARSRGLPLKMVAAGNSSTGEDGKDFSAVVVKKDSAITDAADLAGKTVSVNTLNNIGDTTIRQSIKKDGGDPSAVKFVELPFPDMPAALAEGRVDAAWVVEPFLTIAKKQGAREVASNMVDTDRETMVAAYFTSEKLLTSQPDLVKRFVDAMKASLDFAQKNPDKARAILSSYTKIDPAVADAMVLPRWPSEINSRTVQLMADLAKQDGLVKESVDTAQLLP
jgi:NitT/TauT family transport system substrate-binding protein